MVSSALGPLRVPAEFWVRDEVGSVLDRRDIGVLFRLLGRYVGASQTRIGTATGLAQGAVSLIIKGKHVVSALEVFERIAEGLGMPAAARVRLGLAPREEPLPWTGPGARYQSRGECGAGLSPPSGAAGQVWVHRRLVRCAARGVPLREEVLMAADESAQFHRWSATTNVDDAVLEQMTADVAELAWAEQVDPPAVTYARLLGARDDVFRLIGGHQPPQHTSTLYKIAGQLCGLLALVTFNLGHPHVANTHARTALHCAEVSGHIPMRAFVRWVQSSVAYWDSRYDEAAQLIESALPAATDGTGRLRLASQQARVNGARHQPGEVSRALALASTASTEPADDEPGVLGFNVGTAAFYASEAHYALGGPDHLNVAVDWARTAVDEFSAETQPKVMYVAAARFDLALAYLAKRDLEAVGEHLAPILGATGAEYRTVPIVGRARSLHTLLAGRTDLASAALSTLREDLAGFITHPAPTPRGLESGTTT